MGFAGILRVFCAEDSIVVADDLRDRPPVSTN